MSGPATFAAGMVALNLGAAFLPGLALVGCVAILAAAISMVRA